MNRIPALQKNEIRPTTRPNSPSGTRPVAFTASSCGSVPAPPPPPAGNCADSYPTVCIPPPPPHLKCSDIPYANFRVLWDVRRPDPQHFDRDRDGIGCES